MTCAHPSLRLVPTTYYITNIDPTLSFLSSLALQLHPFYFYLNTLSIPFPTASPFHNLFMSTPNVFAGFLILLDRLVGKVREDKSPECVLVLDWFDVMQYFQDNRDAHHIAGYVWAGATIQGTRQGQEHLGRPRFGSRARSDQVANPLLLSSLVFLSFLTRRQCPR